MDEVTCEWGGVRSDGRGWVVQTVTLGFSLPEVRPWSAEDPHLYTATVALTTSTNHSTNDEDEDEDEDGVSGRRGLSDGDEEVWCGVLCCAVLCCTCLNLCCTCAVLCCAVCDCLAAPL